MSVTLYDPWVLQDGVALSVIVLVSLGSSESFGSFEFCMMSSRGASRENSYVSMNELWLWRSYAMIACWQLPTIVGSYAVMCGVSGVVTMIVWLSSFVVSSSSLVILVERVYFFGGTLQGSVSVP